jgi:hypothetical protein
MRRNIDRETRQIPYSWARELTEQAKSSEVNTLARPKSPVSDHMLRTEIHGDFQKCTLDSRILTKPYILVLCEKYIGALKQLQGYDEYHSSSMSSFQG